LLAGTNQLVVGAGVVLAGALLYFLTRAMRGRVAGLKSP
jgi:hypothetical protein